MGREATISAEPRPSAKHRFLLLFAPTLASIFLRLLGATWKVRFLHPETEASIRAKHGYVLYAFFHGHLLTPSYTHRGRKITVLISRHGDGELIARTTAKLGFRAVRGSSTRGGAAGLKGMLDAAGNGSDLAMITDGPRGPAGSVKRGSVALASLLGVPVLPIGFACSRAWRFRSWDRFTVPKPFSRIAICFGKPILVPEALAEEAMEEYQEKVRQEIVEAEKQAIADIEDKGESGRKPS